MSVFYVAAEKKDLIVSKETQIIEFILSINESTLLICKSTDICDGFAAAQDFCTDEDCLKYIVFQFDLFHSSNGAANVRITSGGHCL